MTTPTKEEWEARLRVVADRDQPREERLRALAWLDRESGGPMTPPDELETVAQEIRDNLG